MARFTGLNRRLLTDREQASLEGHLPDADDRRRFLNWWADPGFNWDYDNDGELTILTAVEIGYWRDFK